MSELSVPMSDFPIVELPEEMNGQFRANVDLAVVNVSIVWLIIMMEVGHYRCSPIFSFNNIYKLRLAGLF
jgi:hypothetical protein